MIAVTRVYELLVSTPSRKDVPVHMTGNYHIAGYSGPIEDCDTAVSAYLASLFNTDGVEVTYCRLVAEAGQEVPPLGTCAVEAARQALRDATAGLDRARWEARIAEEGVEAAEQAYALAVARLRGEDE
jgi:hypothetical protein